MFQAIRFFALFAVFVLVSSGPVPHQADASGDGYLHSFARPVESPGPSYLKYNASALAAMAPTEGYNATLNRLALQQKVMSSGHLFCTRITIMVHMIGDDSHEVPNEFVEISAYVQVDYSDGSHDWMTHRADLPQNTFNPPTVFKDFWFCNVVQPVFFYVLMNKLNVINFLNPDGQVYSFFIGEPGYLFQIFYQTLKLPLI